MQEKINEGQSPLPLFTCLHVKPRVSELMFAGKEVTLRKHTVNQAFSLCITFIQAFLITDLIKEAKHSIPMQNYFQRNYKSQLNNVLRSFH